MRTLALLLVAWLAGCTTTDEPLEAQSLRGTLALVEGLEVRNVRLTVAPDDAAARGASPASAVMLSAPPALARTPLARDHWVLVLELAERAPGAASGAIVARVEWNGEDAGALHLAASNGATDATRAVELRYDVGPRLEASSLYVLTTTKG